MHFLNAFLLNQPSLLFHESLSLSCGHLYPCPNVPLYKNQAAHNPNHTKTDDSLLTWMKEGIKCWHKGEKINWYQKIHVYQLKCLGTPQKQTQGYKHCPGLGTWEEIQENELLCPVLDPVCVPLRGQGWSCWSILGAAVKDLGSGLLLVTVGIHSHGITQELLKAEKNQPVGSFGLQCGCQGSLSLGISY